MSFEKVLTAGVVMGTLFGCVDQYGSLRVPYEHTGTAVACDDGFLLGPDGNCWPISEDTGAMPAADVWAWNLSPETGGTCQYGGEYEPGSDQVHLEIGRTEHGFSLFDSEGAEYPCEVEGPRFRCGGVVTGTLFHDDINVDSEYASDQTSLTFEGMFTTSTEDGIFVRAAGTFSRTHSCVGYRCDDLEEALGPDFSFPCRGLGGFASQIANR